MYNYRLVFKTKAEPDIIIPAHVVERQGLQHKFIVSDDVVTFEGHTFRCNDVKRVFRYWQEDYSAQNNDIAEMPETKRQDNLRRLAYVRAYLQTYRKGMTPAEIVAAGQPKLAEEHRAGYAKFISWYLDPARVERRKQRQAFRSEMYEVFFATPEEFDRCFKEWLPNLDPDRDPRNYRREDYTPSALRARDERSHQAPSPDKQPAAPAEDLHAAAQTIFFDKQA